MWAFLAAGAEYQEGSVVLLGEELERGGVVEGVDGVLLGELFCERDTQLVQVCKCVLGYLRAGCAAEEECGFGVLDCLWGFFVECAFGARVAWFARR